MNFTEGEINLCKEIARYHQKEIKCGDWHLPIGQNTPRICVISEAKKHKKGCTPLWTLEDCLGFLKGKDYYFHLEHYGVNYQITAFHRGALSSIRPQGKTPLEACLKAVLAVLKEKGK